MAAPQKDDRMSVSRILQELERLKARAEDDRRNLADIPQAWHYLSGQREAYSRIALFISEIAK